MEISYAGQEIPVIYRDDSYENPRQKVQIAVEKLDAEQDEPLAGAVFGLYAAEDIQNWKGKKVVKMGTLIATAETIVNEASEVQKAVFSPDLPLGTVLCERIESADGV